MGKFKLNNMSFETNVWDDDLEWNALIHPQMGKLLPFKTGKKTIRKKVVYRDRMTGELEFDLKANMRKIRNDMNAQQVLYDKIKTSDVPYKWVITGYVVFLILMGVGSYLGSERLSLSAAFLVWANVLFFLFQSLILAMITYYCFKQEEYRDCQHLVILTNRINKM